MHNCVLMSKADKEKMLMMPAREGALLQPCSCVGERGEGMGLRVSVEEAGLCLERTAHA